MEMVAVERELGSGQGDIMTRTPNSNHTLSSGIGYDVAFVTWYQEYIMKREYRTPHSPIGNTLGKVT